MSVIWLAAFATLVVSGCKVNSIEGSLGTLFPVPPPPFQPVATLKAVEGTIRNVSSFPIRLEVNFSDVEVTAQHFSLTGATISNFTRVDDTHYEFSVTVRAEGNANIQMELNYTSPDGLILNKPSLVLTYDITPPDAPNSVSLIGAGSSGSERRPSIRVRPTITSDKVALFYDAGCSPGQEAGLGVAVTIYADVKASLLPADAAYLFYAQIIDAAGNKSPCSGQSVAYTLATGLSTNPTARFSSPFTNSTLAELNLNWIDGKEVAVFTNSECSGIPAWEPFTITKRRLIGPDDGEYPFSVLFKSASTNTVGDCIPAWIILDRTAPTPPSVLQLGPVATNFSQTPSISWGGAGDIGAVDSVGNVGSGIDRYDVRIVRVLEGNIEDPSSDWGALLNGGSISVSLDPLSRFRVYVRAVDRAGNMTEATLTREFKTPPLPQPQDSRCPANFIPVPASPDDRAPALRSVPEFCISKYEMSFDLATEQIVSSPTNLMVTDVPYQFLALSYCQSLGAGYSLPTNSQWQILGRAIEENPVNWSSGEIGVGQLNRGGTHHFQGSASAEDNFGCPASGYFSGDLTNVSTLVRNVAVPEAFLNPTGSQCSLTDWVLGRRTHILKNGHVIWDVAGNGAEWTTTSAADAVLTHAGKPSNGSFAAAIDISDPFRAYYAYHFVPPPDAIRPYQGEVTVDGECYDLINGVSVPYSCHVLRGGMARGNLAAYEGVYSMSTWQFPAAPAPKYRAIRCTKTIAP